MEYKPITVHNKFVKQFKNRWYKKLTLLFKSFNLELCFTNIRYKMNLQIKINLSKHRNIEFDLLNILSHKI